MRDSLTTIDRFLNALRHRSAVIGGLEVCALAGTLFCALTLLAAGLGALKLAHEALIALFWLLVFGIPAAWWIRVALPRHLEVRGRRAAARTVDRRIPSTEFMTLTAVELTGEQAVLPEFSRSLIDAAVEEAADRIRFLPVSRVLSYRLLVPWLVALACSAAMLVATAWLAPGPFAASLRAFFSPPVRVAAPLLPSPPPDLSDGPELGDITLTLDFPAYLRRDAKILENASGEVFAPLGTLVNLSAKCAIDAERATVLVDDGPPIAATLSAEGRITATFLVEREGAYRVQLFPPSSDAPVVTRAYPIAVETDAVPTIALFGLEPSNEITANDAVPFSFRAEDDHGLTRVDIVVSGAHGTARRTLRNIDPGRDWEEARVTWYPAEWDVDSNGSVTLWLEVRDNDTVSGPKVGVSERYDMILAGPERQHARVLEAKEALKETLIALLGDLLVQHEGRSQSKPPDVHKAERAMLDQDTQRVFAAFAELAALMDADPLEEITVLRASSALQEELLDRWDALSRLLDKRVEGDQESFTAPGDRAFRLARQQFIETVERAVLSMESFANLQRMETLAAQGRDLRRTGDTLRDMLEALQRSGEAPDIQALLARLDDMERQLAQMAARFAALDRLSAEWFQNPTGETRELQEMMDRIREAIRNGDMAAAGKTLEDYLQATEELLAALEDMQREEFEGLRDEVVKDMEGVIEGLRQMERQQKTLLADTEATREALRQEVGLTDDYLDGTIERALKKVDRIRDQVDRAQAAVKAAGVPATSAQERRTRELLDQLGTLEAALRARDLLQSHREAVETLRGSRVVEAGLNILETRVRADLPAARTHARAAVAESEALLRELDDLLNRMERLQQAGVPQGQGLAARQRSLQRQGEALGQRLDRYAEDSPLIPSQWGQRIQQAAQSMDAASQKLETGELSGGAGDEQVALREIGSLLQELESAREQIAQRMRGGTGGRGKIRFMPNSGGRRGQREYWGGREMRVGRVDISKEFEAPEAYRREIMEGMQGEAPARYKQLNRDYYEKLVH